MVIRSYPWALGAVNDLGPSGPARARALRSEQCACVGLSTARSRGHLWQRCALEPPRTRSVLARSDPYRHVRCQRGASASLMLARADRESIRSLPLQWQHRESHRRPALDPPDSECSCRLAERSRASPVPALRGRSSPPPRPCRQRPPSSLRHVLHQDPGRGVLGSGRRRGRPPVILSPPPSHAHHRLGWERSNSADLALSLPEVARVMSLQRPDSCPSNFPTGRQNLATTTVLPRTGTLGESELRYPVSRPELDALLTGHWAERFSDYPIHRVHVVYFFESAFD